MALPFAGSRGRRRDQVVAIDLGAHSTKAVQLHRKGESLVLTGHAVLEVPQADGGGATVPIAARLTQVIQALGGKCKQVVMAMGAGDCILRPAELPMVPVSDMRSLLRFNAKSYLQQELTDCAFDCHVLPPRPDTKPEVPKAGAKAKVLVGGVKTKLVEEACAAARQVGLTPEALVPELICPVNAFECAQPDVFSREAVALVDLGHRDTSICILASGELVLNRVVAVGGEKLTAGLAESLGTSYAEAEMIKMGLAQEVQATMMTLLSPLCRELRASIDFFEHQEDRTVSQVFVSGAAARSEQMLQVLQTELMAPCVVWSPLTGVQLGLTAQQQATVESVASQLTVAIGAGLAVL